MSDETPAPAPVTHLLLEWTDGDARARDEMLPVVYDELRRLARGYLVRERPDHTLQPTALVHEAYLRLIDQQKVNWRNRAQFVALAALMMRRILVSHARAHAAEKRGAAHKVPLTSDNLPGDAPDIDVMVLHDALEKLAAFDPRKSRIVELKFFGGLTVAEIAEVMQISDATVDRDWNFARAWLYDAIRGDA
jgi:RNA polymerase sigma factor (TIGR02999 family)